MKKWVVIAVLAASVVSGVGLALSNGGADREPSSTPVWLEEVRLGGLIESVNAPGETEPMTKVAIGARVTARIVELPCVEGQVVTKGNSAADPSIPPSVIVRLDGTELEAALRCADARRAAQAAEIVVETNRLESQRAEMQALAVLLQQSELELGRTKDLRHGKISSQSELDQAQSRYDELAARRRAAEFSLKAAEANLEVMKHNLDAAEADVMTARANLANTVITSPIDGVITCIRGKIGEMVVTGTMNNPGTIIMELADLSQMRAFLRADENGLGKLSEGQRAIVRVHAYGSETFGGVVQSIALIPDLTPEGVKYYRVKVLLDPVSRRIFSGLTVDADIEIARHESVLKVPSQAILARPLSDIPSDLLSENPTALLGNGLVPVVFRCVNGAAVITPVRTGGSDANDTAVTAGLSQGDRTIVGPYKTLDSLQHGEAVMDGRPG